MTEESDYYRIELRSPWVDVCKQCGALVEDQDQHNDWHSLVTPKPGYNQSVVNQNHEAFINEIRSFVGMPSLEDDESYKKDVENDKLYQNALAAMRKVQPDNRVHGRIGNYSKTLCGAPFIGSTIAHNYVSITCQDCLDVLSQNT